MTLKLPILNLSKQCEDKLNRMNWIPVFRDFSNITSNKNFIAQSLLIGKMFIEYKNKTF